MIRYGMFLVFLLLSLSRLFAQNPCVKSTEGKDFWFGFMENRPGFGCLIPVPENYIEVTVTSRFSCQFTITLGKSAIAIVTDNLEPNIPKKYKLDRSKAEPFGSENIEEKALHLVSDQPLNLYAMNYGVNSADAAVIFPVEALGNEYYTMCYEPHYELRYNMWCGFFTNGKNSEFVVVATEDQTRVTITPSKVTDKLRPANLPFTIVLSKGELYQVQSMNFPDLAGQGDLTGTHIQSDKPIALYSGAWATTVPNSSVDAWDHLYEQIPPIVSWGRKFVAVPLKSRAKDTYRILASSDQTNVRITNKPLVVIERGKFYEFMLNEDEPSMIESDKPIMLAQFSNSNDVDRPPGVPQASWDGDPAMMIVSPVDQTREEVTFVAYDLPEINQKFFVNIITSDSSVGQIQLDNGSIPFLTIPKTGYSYAQVKIAQGNHNLISTEPGKGFIAYVYGFGGVESYGYGVGFNLNVKLDLGGDLYFAKDTILSCKGESKILDAGSQFSTYLWNTGETTQKINVNKKGLYFVTATSSGGCTLTDSVFLFESNPVVNLGKDTTYCTKFPASLDAGAGFTSYKWSTGETTQKIMASSGGKYSVLVANKFGCQAADTIQLGFAPPPRILLKKEDQLICGSKSTTLEISTDPGTFTLTCTDPSVTVNGLKVTVPEYGTYPFTFSASGGSGCKADTSFTLSFHPIPTVGFNLNGTTCYSHAPEAIYLGSAEISKTFFTWIFASDTIAKGIAADKVQLPMTENQMNTTLYLKVEDKGCINSNSIGEIKLAPEVVIIAADTLVCGMDTVKLTATHSGAALDYLWNWGDGTSDHQTGNGIHSYTSSGQYNIQLKVSFENNCSQTVVKNKFVTVAATPTVLFSLSEKQCLDQGVQSLFYTGSGDDLDKYNWDLSGFQPGEIINNPGNTKGPLLFDMKSNPENRLSLQVISKHGCASEKKELSLRRKPDFAITAAKISGCVPFDAEFLALTLDPIDQVAYHWSFGDGTTGNGAMVAHRYPDPKQAYDVTIIANSQTTGCRDTLMQSQWINVYPLPLATFEVQEPQHCVTDPFLFNAMEQSPGARYHWSWGDHSTSSGKEASHTYATDGKYDVSLSVTNNFGCVDSSLMQGLVYAAPLPTIGFSLDPATCLPLGNSSVSYIGTATDHDKFYWDLSGLDDEEIIQDPGNTPGPLVFSLVNKPASRLSLKIVTEFGCILESNPLNVKRIPLFSFAAGSREGCAPLTVDFAAEAGDPVDQLEFEWTLGSEESITGQEFSHLFTESDRSYSISIKAVSSITGCAADSAESNYILLYPKPQAGFTANPESTFNDRPEVSFLDQSKDAVRFSWDFGDDSSSDLQNPVHRFNQIGVRQVVQTVYNQFDCFDKATSDYVVALNKIYTPNAFSPGAINPVDREFKLYSNGVIADGYHLKILSRWNDVVFECKNEIRGWDGKLKNGTMAQAGNYIWILEFTDFLGQKHRQMGNVMLFY